MGGCDMGVWCDMGGCDMGGCDMGGCDMSDGDADEFDLCTSLNAGI